MESSIQGFPTRVLYFSYDHSHRLHSSVTLMFWLICTKVPCGKIKSDKKKKLLSQALEPSREDRDELKWLISIIWLVQLHKHAHISASISVFCLSMQPRPCSIRQFILPDQFLCHPLYCCELLDLPSRWSDFHACVSEACRRETAHVV